MNMVRMIEIDNGKVYVDLMMGDIQYGRKNISGVKKAINSLRGELIDLGSTIGSEARYSGEVMKASSKLLRNIIFGVIIATLLFSIMMVVYVTRKIVKPVEELKQGIEQVAIRNFDVQVKHVTDDEIGELAAAFQQMALRLKENESYKADILSQFTHEMKSPLGAIKQAINLLNPEKEPLAQKDYRRLISIIKGNNENLFRLINNILKSATYADDKLQLQLNRENVTSLLTNVLMLLSPIIKEKGIKVNLDFSAERIECDLDADRIREAFHNLISNAIKFSRPKTQFFITIADKYPTILIKIQDQGIGIPREEIPYIFEKMYRASNSRDISVKGTGLGLYVVSQIIRAHGGRIEVNSKVGEGTEFAITIPKTRQIAIEGEWL